ncbi:Putative ribonuclease H protein At1g65750 [Linum perenne]
MKLGWMMLKEPDRLWVQLFTAKYLKDTPGGLQIRRKSGGSSIWKGVRRVWQDVARGCQHSIRNGKNTAFWTANWLDSGLTLANHATRALSDSELQSSVSDMCDAAGLWNWELLNSCLPPSIINHVAGMEPPNPNGEEDELIWGPDPKGQFSIKSAYDILASCRSEPRQNLWSSIWKWQGPSRVKHFLWLAAHDRLLTNAERHRRHMTNDDKCHICTGLGDNFFTDNIHAWISNGLKLMGDGLLFGVTTWIIWKARNEDIFDQKVATCDQLRLRVLHWTTGVRETMKADSRALSEVVTRRRETLLRWIPALDEWLTVNCDGSVIQPHGHAAAGGIIRNYMGRRLAVFAANLGTCTIMRAELRAAAIGLELAWNMGARKVHLQVDSQATVCAINTRQPYDYRHSQTILHIHQLLTRNWTVEVSHVYRERNRVVDLPAHHSHSLSSGSHFNFVCSPDIEREISSDIVGVCFPSLISSNE